MGIEDHSHEAVALLAFQFMAKVCEVTLIIKAISMALNQAKKYSIEHEDFQNPLMKLLMFYQGLKQIGGLVAGVLLAQIGAVIRLVQSYETESQEFWDLETKDK